MAEANGNGRFNLFGIPFSVWMVLLGQFAALVVWAIRLDARVSRIDDEVRELAQQDTIPGRLLKQRVDLLDRRLVAVSEFVLWMRDPRGQQPPQLAPLTEERK